MLPLSNLFFHMLSPVIICLIDYLLPFFFISLFIRFTLIIMVLLHFPPCFFLLLRFSFMQVLLLLTLILMLLDHLSFLVSVLLLKFFSFFLSELGCFLMRLYHLALLFGMLINDLTFLFIMLSFSCLHLFL